MTATDTQCIATLDVADIDATMARADIASWEDARLGAAVGGCLATPKRDEANSFILHAPLELLARIALLPSVDPADRPGARRRLALLGALYAQGGEPVVPGRPIDDTAGAQQVADRLVAALSAGDLDDVDACASWLGPRVPPAELTRLLAEPVAASLAAAAHASILLNLLPRVSPDGWIPGGVIRGPFRELGRQPDWRLRWFEHPDLIGEAKGASLSDALAEVPRLGVPGSSFIKPLMQQAEESGVASSLAAPFIDAEPAATQRELARVAAWSMLGERDARPYGWTHCLTLPQAVTALVGRGSSPRTAIAVGATHVIGFRAAFAQSPLRPVTPDPPAERDLRAAISAGPDEAAAAAWHTGPAQRGDAWRLLASRASRHNDAHYVKYTLACRDEAEASPADEPLFLAAAACLAGWWATQATP